MSDKIVVVLGATGLQGGSVVSALLAHGEYAIRGVSRDPSSAASQALVKQGVEMVTGEVSDLGTLISAFKGAWAVFGVTLPFTPVSELQQGRNIVDACRSAEVPLLVWSSLPNATKVSGGKYTKVTHWDQKAQVDEYIKETGQDAVILQTGGFVENILLYHYLRPSPTPGSWTLAWPVVRPTTPLAMSYIGADFGPCVVKVLDVWRRGEGDKLGNEPIPVCSFTMTIREIVEGIEKLSGKNVEYEVVPHMPNEELQQMLLLADEGMRYSTNTFPTPLFVELGVQFHTFEDYVRKELLPVIDGK
ncbi:NAD(P)-binding protein [Calocera viscosa TUFC12733]|uniref:NAD(P)-binding protein n=1 Tax=Calocera viscosa (strain TUFC12733) TaxID=1330018 RepID=A0A167KL18_CALVF|nr:NAD(P)-binding protein [Calocera viscosa TUFC12733]